MPEQMLVVLDGCGGLGRRGEGDEAETARLAPLAVHDQQCLLGAARLNLAAGRNGSDSKHRLGNASRCCRGFAKKVRVNQGFEVGTAASNCIGLIRD